MEARNETYVIANLSVITVRAGTVEFVYRLVDEIRPTSTTVLTSIPLTTDQLHRTIFPPVFRLARAGIIGSSIGAHTVLAGRVSFALVDIVLTMIALVSLVAFAGIATDTIHAGSSLARITVAFVDIYLAIFPRNTLHAKALVSEKKRRKRVQSQSFLRYLFSQNYRSITVALTHSHSRN